MKKRSITVFILLILCIVLSGCTANQPGPSDNAGLQDTLYQVSTLNALMQGVYDGEIPLSDLLKQGDFGIGTFEDLDGEMIIQDKTVYQVLSSGEVIQPDQTVKTPFAMITGFDPDIQSNASDIADYTQLKDQIDTILPSQNMFYAIKVKGTFSAVSVRSVPAQAKPYPPLSDVSQEVFTYSNVKGTLVGYWCPEYVDGINLSGYHLHFLSDDYSMGGHLLDCSMQEGTIYLDTTTNFSLLLPQNDHFAQTGLSGVSEKDIQNIEQ